IRRGEKARVIAHDRQKSYADFKRMPMEFEVGDKVMLKVSPWKGPAIPSTSSSLPKVINRDT
ncbi:hypothetical protein Tco_0392083, partial [Tanacetum coccineum]